MTPKQETAIATLERVVEEHAISKMIDLAPAAQALAISKGISAVAKALDPLVDSLVHLSGTSLGFQTDRAYGKPELKTMMVEAILRGLPLAGNHVNCISGRMYCTLAGYRYLVQNHPGVTDLRVSVGEPDSMKKVDKDVAAFMPVTVTYNLDGVGHREEGKYYVRMFGGGNPWDGLAAKGTRRALKAVYEGIVGENLAPVDADDAAKAEVKDVTPSPKPDMDPSLDESEKKQITIREEIQACESVEDLEEVSAKLTEMKKENKLSPSTIKVLAAAYTKKLEEIDGDSD